MPELRQLLERRANLWEQYQEVLNRATDTGYNADDRQTIDRLDTDVRSLSDDIERVQRAEGHRFDELEPPAPRPDERSDPSNPEARDAAYADAFSAFLRRGVIGLSGENRSALEAGFVASDDLRAQGIATDAAGGYLVPEGFRSKLVERMKFFSEMRKLATVITTTTGNDLPWPTNDDTGNEGAILDENTQVTEQDVIFGQAKLSAYTYTSKMTRVSFQLLQDSSFDLDAWLPRKHGERIGRIQNRHFTTGTGIGQPQGVVTGASVGVAGVGIDATPSFDQLVDLEHSVDVAYRNERSRWMFHDLTLASLRKVKDADGRPLWQPSVEAAVADRFAGRAYTINNHMPQIGANAKSVLFGDFEAGYIVRDVRSVQSLRLTERYADFLQVGFLSFARADGRVDDASAIRALQHAAV